MFLVKFTLDIVEDMATTLGITFFGLTPSNPTYTGDTALQNSHKSSLFFLTMGLFPPTTTVSMAIILVRVRVRGS